MTQQTLEQNKQTNLSGNDQTNQQTNADKSQNADAQQTQTDDLLSRVTKFVKDKDLTTKSDDDIDKEVYNDAEFRAKIDAIQDPTLKEYMVKLRKSGIRGVNEKLTEIADIRKEIQSLKEGIIPKNWTPERVQQLIKDPEFLQAAQQVAGTTDESDGEYVPESVKKKLAEIDNIKNQLMQQQQNQFLQNIEQEHQVLSQKYGNYDRNKVDEIRKDLLEGRIHANSEHLYKAWFHDENVRRAYEMGRQDERGGVSERQRATSFDGSSQQSNTDIKIEKTDSDKQVWQKIVNKAMMSIQKK